MTRVVLVLGDNVSTDALYPGRYMATVLPSETPPYAFADEVEFNRALNAAQVPPGSVVAAGENFGCGSSREQAASALKGHELVVVARGFARIFLQNAVNLGLRVLHAPDLQAAVGDDLDLLPDRVINRTSGRDFAVVPLGPARQAIVEAGGLIAYVRKRLIEESSRA